VTGPRPRDDQGCAFRDPDRPQWPFSCPDPARAGCLTCEAHAKFEDETLERLRGLFR
jgi:hypothetical protein